MADDIGTLDVFEKMSLMFSVSECDDVGETMPSRVFLIVVVAILITGLAAIFWVRNGIEGEAPNVSASVETDQTPATVNVDRTLGLFSEFEKQLQTRKIAGEDVHAELMDLYDELIEAIAKQNDAELLRALRVNKAVLMSLREPELALQEYNKTYPLLLTLGLYERETYATEQSRVAVKQVLDRFEASSSRLDMATRDRPENFRRHLLSIGLNPGEIAKYEKMFDESRRIALARQTYECDREFIAGIRSMVELVVEARGQVDFLPDRVLQFHDPILQSRMETIQKAMDASNERREMLNKSLRALK